MMTWVIMENTNTGEYYGFLYNYGVFFIKIKVSREWLRTQIWGAENDEG